LQGHESRSCFLLAHRLERRNGGHLRRPQLGSPSAASSSVPDAALRGNRSIGTAVGMIMERHQLTSDSAFEALRREARNKRLSLARLAAQIVSGLVELHLPLRAGGTRA